MRSGDRASATASPGRPPESRARRAASGASPMPASTRMPSTSRRATGPSRIRTQRDRIVGRSRSSSAAVRMRTVPSGGSSRVLRNAAWASSVIRSAAVDDATRAPPSTGRSARSRTRSRTPRSSRPPIGITLPGPGRHEPVHVRVVAVLERPAPPAGSARMVRRVRRATQQPSRPCHRPAWPCRRRVARRAAARAACRRASIALTAVTAAGWPRVRKPARPVSTVIVPSGAMSVRSGPARSGGGLRLPTRGPTLGRRRFGWLRSNRVGRRRRRRCRPSTPSPATGWSWPFGSWCASPRSSARPTPRWSPRPRRQRQVAGSAAPRAWPLPSPGPHRSPDSALTISASALGRRPRVGVRRAAPDPPAEAEVASAATAVRLVRRSGGTGSRTRAQLRPEHRLDLRRYLAPRLVAGRAWRGALLWLAERLRDRSPRSAVAALAGPGARSRPRDAAVAR